MNSLIMAGLSNSADIGGGAAMAEAIPQSLAK
jgi:hypothetical protein